jgi:hypothetical protein
MHAAQVPGKKSSVRGYEAVAVASRWRWALMKSMKACPALGYVTKQSSPEFPLRNENSGELCLGGGHTSGTSTPAVYLHTADKYRRFTYRLPQEQKGLDERARIVSQRPFYPW